MFEPQDKPAALASCEHLGMRLCTYNLNFICSEKLLIRFTINFFACLLDIFAIELCNFTENITIISHHIVAIAHYSMNWYSASCTKFTASSGDPPAQLI